MFYYTFELNNVQPFSNLTTSFNGRILYSTYEDKSHVLLCLFTVFEGYYIR